MKRFLIAFSFFVALIILWQVLFSLRLWSPVLLPSPLSVGRYLWASMADGSLLQSSWTTMKRLMIGYSIGCAVGLPLGLLSARTQWVGDTIGLLALGLQTLPSVCWVPLALIWFNQSEGAMLFVVVMGTLWSVLIAVDNGVRHLPPIYVRAARTMGSRGWHTLRLVVLPASLPCRFFGLSPTLTGLGHHS